MAIKSPKKLIEVALPLDDINAAAAREKSIRHGHPSTLHLWWARRPLAAARAVLFAQMVNDPGGERGYKAGLTREQANAKREKLFEIIRELVKWENTNNEQVLERARAAIRESWRETCEMNKGKPGFDPDKLPAFHDPFAGGGAIPLEAQRLGLEAHASDLNPVAVLINKAMIEIPPTFAGQKPVGPEIDSDKTSKKKSTRDSFEDWYGARGLAEDVRRYSQVLRDLVWEKIGRYYPMVEVDPEFGGGKRTVLAWLWSRTVTSPNPAARGKRVPLVSSFWLCKKKGKEAWVQIEVDDLEYRFKVRKGRPDNPEEVASGTKTARGANFKCLLTGTPITADYVKAEGKAGRMGWKLLAIVAEGDRGRVYASPTLEHEELGLSAVPDWKPNGLLSTHPQYMSCTNYGPKAVGDLFMSRQAMALDTFCQTIPEVHRQIIDDAIHGKIDKDDMPLESGGKGASAYADAICTYLGLGISRLVNRQSTNTFWDTAAQNIQQVFARHALPFMWDTAEGNPFSSSSGNFMGQIGYLCKVVENLPAKEAGVAFQQAAQDNNFNGKVISTDPPYYDNVPYADLSDFFYVWLRHAIGRYQPALFGTMLVPKAEELVANHIRAGGVQESEKFFLEGMASVMSDISSSSNASIPITIYYAFRQSDTKDEGTASTGWETFVTAVIDSGLSITGTWPVRTELTGNLKKKWNALASSIVLVCRPRETTAESISRKDFQRQLRAELPEALETMIGGREGEISPIAPVDLAQAAIGPGMAVYSRYSRVLEADGSPMKVREALILINRVVDEYFNEAGEELDADTRFCIDWFQTNGWKTGKFGEADTLARAKGTSVEGVQEAGVVESGAGKVRLLRWKEYPSDWDPGKDHRLPAWEALHHLIRALNQNGESAAGQLLGQMPERGESLRQLAYRLYTLCERKKWAEDARAYNEIIQAWGRIVEESTTIPAGTQSTFELL